MFIKHPVFYVTLFPFTSVGLLILLPIHISMAVNKQSGAGIVGLVTVSYLTFVILLCVFLAAFYHVFINENLVVFRTFFTRKIINRADILLIIKTSKISKLNNALALNRERCLIFFKKKDENESDSSFDVEYLKKRINENDDVIVSDYSFGAIVKALKKYDYKISYLDRPKSNGEKNEI